MHQEETSRAGDTAATAEFLRAAERLRRELAWHQQQVAEIRSVLAQHGVRAGLLVDTTRSRRTEAAIIGRRPATDDQARKKGDSR